MIFLPGSNVEEEKPPPQCTDKITELKERGVGRAGNKDGERCGRQKTTDEQERFARRKVDGGSEGKSAESDHRAGQKDQKFREVVSLVKLTGEAEESQSK